MKVTAKSRATVARRISLMRRAIENNLSVDFLSKLMDATKKELREFVRLNMIGDLAAFDTLPENDLIKTTGKTPEPIRSPEQATRRPSFIQRSRQGPYKAPLGRPSVLDEEEQRLYLFITGQLQFSEDERPFNNLPPNEQAIIGEQAQRILEMRG